MPTLALKAFRLRKRYGSLDAVDDVSFELRHGEILGLLGPNGAGKTTTINMVLGVLQPSSGTVEIEGIDIARHRSQALARTNFAAVYAALPGNLTVYQNLRFFGLLYDVARLNARIDALLAEFDLERLRNTRSGVLSSGEQTRLALAKALLNAPRLLLLDEPTASLDPSAADQIRSRIRAMASARATAASSGPPITCTKSRRPAIAYCSSRTAGFCSREIPGHCRANMAPPRSRNCSSAWRASRWPINGTHREIAADRGDCAASAVFDAQQPGAGVADDRLGRGRHRALGIHCPLSEQCDCHGHQFHRQPARARCCSGISSRASCRA
jgi:ABC-2 type transport system ATP-binding protein